MKMVVFWVVAPCSLVEASRRFKGVCCLHHQGATIYKKLSSNYDYFLTTFFQFLVQNHLIMSVGDKLHTLKLIRLSTYKSINAGIYPLNSTFSKIGLYLNSALYETFTEVMYS
jgi:hypothetical protein